MSDRYQNAREEAADCVISLCKAVQQAGGSINADHLKMTLRDFITTIAAQNNIRFFFDEPNVDSIVRTKEWWIVERHGDVSLAFAHKHTAESEASTMSNVRCIFHAKEVHD